MFLCKLSQKQERERQCLSVCRGLYTPQEKKASTIWTSKDTPPSSGASPKEIILPPGVKVPKLPESPPKKITLPSGPKVPKPPGSRDLRGSGGSPEVKPVKDEAKPITKKAPEFSVRKGISRGFGEGAAVINPNQGYSSSQRLKAAGIQQALLNL